MYHNGTPILSQVEFLERKLGKIEEQIELKKDSVGECNASLTDLYFQKGKLYSELELARRVRPYED